MSGALTGGCACGAIRYSAKPPAKFTMRCQCRACQHDGGGAHLPLVAVLAEGFESTGAPAYFERKGDSGLTVRKAFCPQCGCPLWGMPERASALVMLMAGSLDDASGITMGETIYTASAQPWDCLAQLGDT